MTQTLQIGDIIKMRSWHGIVLDIFQNTHGKTVLRVQTVRNIFRKLGPELIEVDLAPEQITRATASDLQKEIELHQQMLNHALQEFTTYTQPKVNYHESTIKLA